MTKTLAYGTKDSHSHLKPMEIERRALSNNDVKIDIEFCGVCHSDLHQAKNDWANTVYPCVPGHEIVGRVAEIGSDVKGFKIGDLVGVGCMVDSCDHCESCAEGLEQYCENGPDLTYNGNMRKPNPSSHTFGGYAQQIVVKDHFVLRMPANLDPAAAAPLLCAGITTYSPLRHWDIGEGDRVGVIGMGGLGHMAIKLAVAMGAEVTAITTSPDKGEHAKSIGAHHVIVSKEKDQMAANANSFDFILNTIPVSHDLNPYIALLRRDGILTVVGCLTPFTAPMAGGTLIMGRKSVNGSLIGGIEETQEMLDFCGAHNILPEIKTIPIDEINDAFKTLEKGDADYRFVIDMSTLKAG